MISSCAPPGVCALQVLSFLLLWHSALSCHSKPAAMLFTCSPPGWFFISLPSPPSLCLSVCPLPTSSSDRMNLPRPPCPTPSPSSPQPCAPSPTSPDEFPMNVKQAYKAFAAVPRSLAVLEPPQVGCDAWTESGSQPEPHAVMSAWSHPGPSTLELLHVGGGGLVTCCDVWNALIFFFPLSTGVPSFSLSVQVHSSIRGEYCD